MCYPDKLDGILSQYRLLVWLGFLLLRKKLIEFLMTWVWIDLAALSQLIYQHSANRGGLLHKPGGFLGGSPRLHIMFTVSFQF